MSTLYEPGRVWRSPGSSSVLTITLTPDNTHVIVGSSDGMISSFDLVSGSPVGASVQAHTDSIRALVLTADGSQIVSSGDDGLVQITNRANGPRLGMPLSGHDGSVWALAVTSDGTQIVTGGGDRTIRIWDRTSHQQLTRLSASDAAGAVRALVLNKDDSRIITGHRDGGIRFWNRVAKEPDGNPLVEHHGAVLALAVSTDGANLVSGTEDGTVRIWHIPTRKPAEDTPTDLGGSAVNAVALTPNGNQIVISSADGIIRIWDRGRRQIVATLEGHEGSVLALALTADGSRIITGGEDGTVRVWNSIADAAPPVEPEPEPVHRHAGVRSDFESSEDKLGFTTDVHAVAALLAATETPPQLSIALLGDWGSGKSSFICQVLARVDKLADAYKQDPRSSPYAAHIGQVRFNAWHYSDDHLWVGLVEHLLEEITYRQQEHADNSRRESLRNELDDERRKHKQSGEALDAVQRVTAEPGWVGRVNQPTKAAMVLWATTGSIWRELRAPRRLLIAVGILFGICLIAVAARFGQAAIGWVAGIIAMVGGLLAPVALVWRRTTKFFDEAQFFDEALNQLKKEHEGQTAKIKELEAQLVKVDPSFRLERLLSEIGSPARYEQYRGLTGRIHRDLARLNSDMTAAQEDWTRGQSKSPPPLQRIILYIDDLDRCPASQVVQVLQAVNLLLTMPLFLVVVAADPRWLLSALEGHHGNLFETDQRLRALNYLDKIFQIPYAIQPMRKHAAEYLRDLLPPTEQDQPVPAPDQAPPTSDTPSVTSPQRSDPSQGQGNTGSSKDSASTGGATLDVTTKDLRLRQVERDFLPLLTPLLATPRAVKKLTNLYRLLRIAIPDPEIDQFVGGSQGGPYQAAALLLAAVVSAPAEADSLLSGLYKTTHEDTCDIVNVLRSLDKPPPIANRLADLIETIRRQQLVHGDIYTYHAWARVVARYSFETYYLVSAQV